MRTEMGIEQLEKQLKEIYAKVSANHLSLLLDILTLLQQTTMKRRTYIDALDLLNIAERNCKGIIDDAKTK